MASKADLKPLTVGTFVRVRHADFDYVEIVQCRGPLGPGGMRIYRVRIFVEPRPFDVEVREDQLVIMPTPKSL